MALHLSAFMRKALGTTRSEHTTPDSTRAGYELRRLCRGKEMTEKPLSLNEVRRLIRELKESVIKNECWSCECFQAVVAQLEIDGTPGVAQQILPLKISAREIRPCLGCDPCPPAELFARYLDNKTAAGRTRRCPGDDATKLGMRST